MKDKELGAKLKEARERLELTLAEVAERLGFTHYQTLSSIEKGERQIKAHELAKLAQLYLLDMKHFLFKESSSVKTAVQWRSSVGVAEDKVKRAEFLRYCENYFDLETRLQIKQRLKLPLRDDLSPENFDSSKYGLVADLANQYQKILGLGSRPACLLGKVLEENFNVKIFYLDLDTASAACAVGEFGTAILLNKMQSPLRTNFNLAHELFHIITWNVFNPDDTHHNCDEKPVIEKYADAFAANLLMPQEEVMKKIAELSERSVSLLDLVGIAREFEVSTEAFLWRLVNLNSLDKKVVDALKLSGKLTEVDKDYKGRKNIADGVSARYINMALKAYQLALISKGKLAEYLNVEKYMIDSKLQEFGYTDEESYEAELTITGR